MRIDVTRSEFEVIIDCLKGQALRCMTKVREQLAQRLDWQLHPSKAPDSNGWAPMKKKVSIRSSMPDGIVKPQHRKDWSFHKPRNKKSATAKVAKKPLTADEILNEL
jgi:hypothetical protein